VYLLPEIKNLIGFKGISNWERMRKQNRSWGFGILWTTIRSTRPPSCPPVTVFSNRKLFYAFNSMKGCVTKALSIPVRVQVRAIVGLLWNGATTYHLILDCNLLHWLCVNMVRSQNTKLLLNFLLFGIPWHVSRIEYIFQLSCYCGFQSY
jgi:hypothetical protein